MNKGYNQNMYYDNNQNMNNGYNQNYNQNYNKGYYKGGFKGYGGKGNTKGGDMHNFNEEGLETHEEEEQEMESWAMWTLTEAPTEEDKVPHLRDSSDDEEEYIKNEKKRKK